MSASKRNEVAGERNGLNFRIHRRRTRWSPTAIRRELEAERERFFTRGKTGSLLFWIIKYIGLNSKGEIRRKTLEMALEIVSSWLNEEISSSATPEERLTMCEARIGIATHAINWASKKYSYFGVQHEFVLGVLTAAKEVLPGLHELREQLSPKKGNDDRDQLLLF